MQLSQETVAQIKNAQALIDSKELEVAALKNHVRHILKEETGVDITKGYWDIDLSTGSFTPSPPR